MKRKQREKIKNLKRRQNEKIKNLERQKNEKIENLEHTVTTQAEKLEEMNKKLLESERKTAFLFKITNGLRKMMNKKATKGNLQENVTN